MGTMLRSLRFVRRLNAGRGAGRLGAPALHRLVPTTTTTTSTSRGLGCSVACPYQDRNYVTEVAIKQDYARANVDDVLREIDRKIKKLGFVKENDLKQILDLVVTKGSMTSTQALLLIRCCGNFLFRENIDTREMYLKKIWELAKSLGVAIDVSHYNALLLVYLDNETNFSPLDILIEMKQMKITPNRVTFQRLIEKYCKNGDVAGATKILEHMSEHDIALNENIFNSLIIGHSMADDVPNALKILDIMKQAGIEPTVQTYGAILCVHAKTGDINAIRSVLMECKNKDLILTDKEILEVVYTLALNKHSELVEEILSNANKGVTYNRNAIQYICKLLEKQETNTAFIIQKSLLKSSSYSDEGKTFEGHFFLRKLITSNYDAETIIKYCDLMIGENINPLAYEISLYTTYQYNKHHLAIPLLKAMKKSGREVREHYFYPIFVSHSKANNLQGILNTMRAMIFDFEIPPNILTVKDYIIPYMTEDPINNVTTLLNNNLSFSTATNAILIYLLEENKSQQAWKFLKNTRMVCRTNFLEKPLIRIFLNNNDVNTLINILHYQLCMKSKNTEDKSPDEILEDLNNSKKLINNVIGGIIKQMPQYNINKINEILNGLLEKGMNINQAVADSIRKSLGQDLQPEIENVLNKLVSENLELQPLQFESNQKQQSIHKQRFRNISNLEEKAKTSSSFKMVLIQEQTKLLNQETVEKLLKELETENPTYTIGFCATLIDYYSKMNNVEEADKWFQRLNTIDPESKIDKTKILNYAILLIKNNRSTDALQVLSHSVLNADINREKSCEKLLNTVLEYNPDQVEEFFNKLKEHGFFTEVTSLVLTPIVKYYLNTGNIEKAIEKFKWAVETYKITPAKSSLMINLINNEDAKTLQHVTDLCTQIYGESNALFDLSLAFFETNRLRQARKILETPGLRVKQDRIVYAGNNYFNSRNEKELQKFIQLLNGLQYDLTPLYYMLLQLYEMQNDWKKSLSLWTQMQEDNIQPSVQFMNKLEYILRINNQDIPFAKSEETQKMEPFLEVFHEALHNEDVTEAKEALKNLPEKIKNIYLLKLINFYVDKNNIDAALENLNEFWYMKHKNFPELQNTVLNILKKLKDANDFEKISNLMSNLKSNLNRNKTNFFIYSLNKILHESKIYEDLLNYWESISDNKEKTEQFINSMFHVTTAVKVLLDQPELEEKFKQLASKAKEYNLLAPVNVIWIYKFLKDSPDAEQFRKDNLKFVYELSLIFACKETGAWEKLPLVVDKVIENEDNKPKNKSITVLLQSIVDSDIPNKYELAFECLRKAVKRIPLNALNKNLVQQIEKNLSDKTALESLRTERERNLEAATG